MNKTKYYSVQSQYLRRLMWRLPSSPSLTFSVESSVSSVLVNMSIIIGASFISSSIVLM